MVRWFGDFIEYTHRLWNRTLSLSNLLDVQNRMRDTGGMKIWDRISVALAILCFAAAAEAAGTDPQRTFHDHIRPYLSADGERALFGPGAIRGGAGRGPLRLPPAEVAAVNVLVNDPDGQVCGAGCTQSELTLAQSGTNVVVGFNDSEGFQDPLAGGSGFAYSTNGGASFVDGGGLPIRENGDLILGDPVVVACDGAFYYASLYQTGCTSEGTGTQVAESEPNDSPGSADPLALGQRITGEVAASGDADVVGFFAPAGTSLLAQTKLGTLPDSVLTLLAPDGVTVLAANDDVGPFDLSSRISLVLPESGTYFLVVTGLGGSPGTYELDVSSCVGPVPPGRSAISVSRGTFNGSALVFEPPTVAAYASDPAGLDFLDKDFLACDPVSGTLYVSYTNFLFTGSMLGQVELVRSNDGGVTWSFPPTIVQPEHNSLVQQGTTLAIGTSGEVHLAWARGIDGTAEPGHSLVALRTSVNGGASFGPRVTAARFTDTSLSSPLGYNRPNIAIFPSLAVDRSNGAHRGATYVVYPDADASDGSIRDIKLARSIDGGASFTAPVDVNRDPPGSDQFFPVVAVDPSRGQVGVLYYSTQLDHPFLTDVFLSLSIDGGASFVPGVRVTDISSDWGGSASDAAPNFGDYISMTSDGPAFLTAWGDGRRGDPDAFFSRVPRRSIPSCATIANGGACDDGNVCTTGDICQGNRCVGSPTVVCTGEPDDCSTGEICDSRAGCVRVPRPDGTTCEAGVACSVASNCSAGECVSPGGGDHDGDGVCRVDDNCPGVANPDRADADRDGAGNACDSFDVKLQLHRVTVQRSTSAQRANGRIRIDGEFLVLSPGDSLDTSDGLTVRVRDGLNLDRVLDWVGTDCKPARNGHIRCRRHAAPHNVADLRTLPSSTAGAQVVVVSLRLMQLELEAPFQPPLKVNMVNGPRTPVRGIDRIGLSTDCRSSARGIECTGNASYGSPMHAFLGTLPETIFD